MIAYEKCNKNTPSIFGAFTELNIKRVKDFKIWDFEGDEEFSISSDFDRGFNIRFTSVKALSC